MFLSGATVIGYLARGTTSMHAGTQQPPLLAPLTQEDLGQLQIHLPALKIISYRGPGHQGGVVSSLSPLTKQLGTQVNWIALSGVPEGQDQAVPGFTFHRPDVSPHFAEQNARAVHEYLWPLLHGLTDKAQFDADAWKAFRQLSQTIASQSLKVSMRSFPSLVWFHDFEVCLVPPMLPMDAGVILSHFWHAPWPEAEVMVASPVGREIVESLLHNKVIGFHTQEYADNFLDTAKKILGSEGSVDIAKMTVTYRNNTTHIVSMPLGIDFQYWQRLARTARVEAESLSVRHRLANQILLGVDRLDYTKGILEKLNGLEAFLQKHPDWARRFHYVQLVQHMEQQSPALDAYRSALEKRVREINETYSVDGWEPIVYIEGTMGHQRLAAWYQAADMLLVTPVRDGLNLIAKEYVASRLDEQGVVVLSNQAGVSAELVSGALLVDANAPDEIAHAMLRGLSMPVEEKRRRMVSMRHVVGWNRLHDWACGFLRFALTVARRAG
jgi:trehalose 6-phosphate synthase